MQRRVSSTLTHSQPLCCMLVQMKMKMLLTPLTDNTQTVSRHYLIPYSPVYSGSSPHPLSLPLPPHTHATLDSQHSHTLVRMYTQRGIYTWLMTHVISVSIVTWGHSYAVYSLHKPSIYAHTKPPPSPLHTHTSTWTRHYHKPQQVPLQPQIMSMLQPAEVFGEATRLVGLGSPLFLADKCSEGNC